MDENDSQKSFFELEAERLTQQKKLQNLLLGVKNHKEPWASKVLNWLIGTTIGIFISLCVIVPLAIYSTLSYGFVAMKLWQWFVVPLGLIPINLFQAAGLVVLARLLTWEHIRQNTSDLKTNKERVTYFIGVLLIPWVLLLLGYLAHCFV